MRKFGLLGIVWVTALFLFLSCNKRVAIPAPSYSASMSPGQRDASKTIFDILDRKCGFSSKWSTDIESISLSIEEDFGSLINEQGKIEAMCMTSRCEDFGWKKHLLVIVKIKPRTEAIPTSYRAFGHNLIYDIGVEGTPGVSIGKQAAARLCGDNSDQSDFFLSLDGISNLKI